MIRSSFFNSLNGDRKYNANNFAEYFASFIGNGVFLESFDITTNENMTITVKEGKGWINGYIIINDYDYILTIANADGVLNRIDRVVLRWDSVDREIRLEVKKGVFATTPAAPTLQRDEDGYELAICDILIPAGTSKITISNLVDTRENNNLCGYVDSLIAGNIDLLKQKVENIENGTTEVPNATNSIKLKNPKKINGVNFDGTQDITVADDALNTKVDGINSTLDNKINNVNSVLTEHRNSTIIHVTQSDKTLWNSKPPTNHASANNTYGLGSISNYGHVKTINSLTQASHLDGTALSAHQGKVLNDKIDANPHSLTFLKNVTFPTTITGDIAIELLAPFAEGAYEEIVVIVEGTITFNRNGGSNAMGRVNCGGSELLMMNIREDWTSITSYTASFKVRVNFSAALKRKNTRSSLGDLNDYTQYASDRVVSGSNLIFDNTSGLKLTTQLLSNGTFTNVNVIAKVYTK